MQNYKVCLNCDHTYLNDFCFNCGKLYVIKKDESEPKEQKIAVSERGDISTASIFDKIGDPYEVVNTAFDGGKSKKGETIILFTLILLAGLVGFMYYYVLKLKEIPKFLSPVQVSSDLTDNSNALNIGSGDNVDSTIDSVSTIPVKLDIIENAFTNLNLFTFMPTKDVLALYTFDVVNVLKKYYAEDKLKQILIDFDVKEDDVSVYLSKNFILAYRNDSIENYAYIAEVLNKEFIKKKTDAYQTKEDQIAQAERKKIKPKNLPKLNTRYKVKLVDIGEDKEKKTYLLISNSSEFLDLLKESSEGNLVNLTNDALFKSAQKELPTSGQVFIYKKGANDAFKKFAEAISPKFEYVGLDKILEKFKKNGLVLYTKEDKLKIVQSTE